MKTLKTITAALLITISFSAFAADGKKSEKREMNYALKTYIDAMAEGKLAALPEVLDKDVKFSFTRGEKIVSHSKIETLHALKVSENVKQNCTTQYKVVESTPFFSVVKVTMAYDGFSRVSYLNLANTSDGWKITSVSTSYI